MSRPPLTKDLGALLSAELDSRVRSKAHTSEQLAEWLRGQGFQRSPRALSRYAVRLAEIDDAPLVLDLALKQWPHHPNRSLKELVREIQAARVQARKGAR